MIVYGSPQRTVATSEALTAVRSLAQQAQAEPSAEGMRRLLLALGELAQGVADAPDPNPATVQCLHDALLLVGTAHYWQQEPTLPEAMQALQAALDGAIVEVATLTNLPLPPQITIHQPEGFAFYGLYPEQYFYAVQASPLWQIDPARRIGVIGIRSIGTALAGALGGALAARGAAVRVTSVRPTGHPFARELVPDAELLQWITEGTFAAYAVVDEGPGLSGSSFATVGRALLDAGVAGDAIYFFPAHGHGPGSAAGPAVHAVWDAVRVCPPPAVDLPFSLPDWPTAWRGSRRPLAHASSWGAVPPFERPAWVLEATTNQPATLLSFAGLGAYGDIARMRAEATAQAGYASPATGWSHGWLATAWPDSPPQIPADFNDLAMQYLVGYVAQIMGTYGEQGTAEETLDTLQEMFYWNTWEALGEPAAAATRRYAEPDWRTALAAAPLIAPPPGLRPDEWHIAPEGTPRLALPLGRLHGHPLPTRADPAWTLAAIVANFALDSIAEEAFCAAYVAAGGVLPSPERRRFYRLAYAAFLAGRSKLEAEAGGDWAAYGMACDRLRTALADEG